MTATHLTWLLADLARGPATAGDGLKLRNEWRTCQSRSQGDTLRRCCSMAGACALRRARGVAQASLCRFSRCGPRNLWVQGISLT
jgi:hypothetical protein